MRAVRSLDLDFRHIGADLERLMAHPVVLFGQEWELTSVYQQLRQTLNAFLSAVLSGTVNVVVSFASTFFWLVFILLSAFYLVKDADRIVDWMESLPPSGLQEDFGRLRRQIDHHRH